PAAVRTLLAPDDPPRAGPCLAAYDHVAVADRVPVLGRHDHRADADRAHRSRRVAVLVIVHIPAELVVTAKRLRENLEPLEPFHAGHAVPARDDQPDGRSVLREDRPAIHLEGEEGVRVPRLGEREGPRERNFVRAVRWPSSVRANREDFDRAWPQTGGFQDGPQGDARPSGCAHRAELPRLARRERLESGATIACALDRPRQSASAHTLDVAPAHPPGAV